MWNENITYGFLFLTNFKDFKKIIWYLFKCINVNFGFIEKDLNKLDFSDICYKIMDKYS